MDGINKGEDELYKKRTKKKNQMKTRTIVDNHDNELDDYGDIDADDFDDNDSDDQSHR